MDAARREKKEHGTLSFPFQIYPALDGSEADDSDFIPYHWHPELEIITVDCGRVSLTIADRMYEGARGDVFFAASEELHEIRAAGRENQFRSFVFAADFLQFARADETEFALLEPLAEGRLRFATCLRSGEPGQSEVRTLLAQIVRTWQQQAPGCQLAVKAALLGIVAVCAQYGRLEGRPVRPGADYRARQLREIVGYLGEHFTEPLSLPEVASHFGLSPQYFSTFFGKTSAAPLRSTSTLCASSRRRVCCARPIFRSWRSASASASTTSATSSSASAAYTAFRPHTTARDNRHEKDRETPGKAR
ncbi:MAG: AraC family ligand binding domain-containing protein [Agathobaculum sp.]